MERLQRWGGFGPRGGKGSLVVAAVHSAESRRAAQALLPGSAPDWLELRVDHFAGGDLTGLAALAARPPRPLLITVRRPDEGGAHPALADGAARAKLYERFLPGATAVDIEVRSLRTMAGVIGQAKARGCWLVASFHDFQGTPSVARLRTQAARALDAGADVLKVASLTERPGDLARLLDLLEKEDRLPLAVMGMGRLGRVSRLVLAAAGSVLNYGYLGDQPQVPGQWPAAVLRARLDELRG